MRIESKEILAVGIFGGQSRVGDRIETLLRRGRTFSPRASGKGVIASALVLSVLLLAGSLTPHWIAFAEEQPPPSFEVASVKPGDPNGQPNVLYRLGGRFTASSATLRMLMGNAWDLRDHQISGGPAWLNSAKYDIDAKAGGAAVTAAGPASARQMRPMLQSLLTDRFKLAFHRETREEPVYELVVDKGGSKLKEAAAAFPSGTRGGRGELQGMAASMTDLTYVLAQTLGRSVVDKTVLTGRYDFKLTWTPAPGLEPEKADGPQALPRTDAPGPSIFTALREQLGLKLQPAKGPVAVLVIDHAEKPDAN